MLGPFREKISAQISAAIEIKAPVLRLVTNAENFNHRIEPYCDKTREVNGKTFFTDLSLITVLHEKVKRTVANLLGSPVDTLDSIFLLS